jgi:hypothetical protein
MISNLATGSELVWSGLFVTRQNLYYPTPEGTCLFAQIGVHAQDRFFAGFFRVAGARVRWWITYASAVVSSPSFVLFYLSPVHILCEMVADASWYGNSRIGVVLY